MTSSRVAVYPFPFYRRSQTVLLKHVRRALYEVVVAALDSSRAIHMREIRRRDDGDPSREPDGILYWARRSELLEQTRVNLADRWKLE